MRYRSVCLRLCHPPDNDGTFEILRTPAARLFARHRPSGALNWAICGRLETISFGMPGSVQ
jgi:hypothetical protein